MAGIDQKVVVKSLQIAVVVVIGSFLLNKISFVQNLLSKLPVFAGISLPAIATAFAVLLLWELISGKIGM